MNETRNIIAGLELGKEFSQICYYDRKEKKLKPLVIDINHPKSIFSPLVRVHTIDNQGNAWMASARGVYKLSFSPQSFHFNQTDHEAETRAFPATTAAGGSGAHQNQTMSAYMLPTGTWKAIFPNKAISSRNRRIFLKISMISWKTRSTTYGWEAKVPVSIC